MMAVYSIIFSSVENDINLPVTAIAKQPCAEQDSPVALLMERVVRQFLFK